MRLLVVTQAVDQDDPTLGFFHPWLEALATRFDSTEVICLKEGRRALPAKVHVYSLGKPHSAKAMRGVGAHRLFRQVRYSVRFVRLAWRLRRDYDAVFVHMNEEYVLLFGLFWRLLGKRVVFWRNHKMGSWATRLAIRLSNTVCYTSPDAFAAPYANAMQMPVGIDTERFTPPVEPPAPDSMLFLGRLDPVKKVEVFIEALGEVRVHYRADLYGSPTEPGSAYAKDVREQAEPLIARGTLALHSAVSNERARELYQQHAIYLNLTPSGSFDKTIGEAMASGCVVVCVNDALREVIHGGLLARANDAQDVARALTAALSLSVSERVTETRALRAYIESQHSLDELVARLVRELRG